MLRRKFNRILLLLPIITLFTLPDFSHAYVASSSTYRIDNDTISVGGLLASSTNYSTESSISGLEAGISTSTSFTLNSGYLAMGSAYLAVSTPSNVSMSPAINTSGGGVGNGSTSWTVTTDSSGGYSLSVRANTSPALKSSTDSFPDYQTVSVGVPDYNFREGAAVDFFGFSPEGNDIKSLYKDDGISACNSGSSDTADKCWDSITTSNKTIALSAAANNPSGTATTIKFRAAAGTSINKTAGSYSATIIVTVLAL
jgi:hypothetical protein